MEGVKSLTVQETRYFLGSCHIHLSQLTFTLCSKHGRLLGSASQMSSVEWSQEWSLSPHHYHMGHCDTCPISITYVTMFQSQHAVSMSSVLTLPFCKGVKSHTAQNSRVESWLSSYSVDHTISLSGV